MIMEALLNHEADARELSAVVGLPQKEVVGHLEHIQKSLHRSEYRFKVFPAECRNCGFTFSKRERLTKPGKCPACHKQYIREPKFVITKKKP